MRRVALLLALCVTAGAACSSDPAPEAATSSDDPPSELVAAVASFDVSPERTERFIVGLFASTRGDVALGEVQLSFAYTGSTDGTEPSTPPDAPETTSAGFLPIPGTEQVTGDEPTFEPPAGARGVYATPPLRFPEPGVWQVTVDATVDGQELTTSTAFEVYPTSAVPGPGDPAPRTTQPLPGDPSVAPESIDSRLAFDEELADPGLHRTTVADALDAGRPVMLTVTTPVFCVSRFCGPITDELARLEAVYGDRVEFVHLEVWKDFEGAVLNKAAAEWVAPQDTERAAEPWVCLVDATGTITARWDNVASVHELTAALDDIVS